MTSDGTLLTADGGKLPGTPLAAAASLLPVFAKSGAKCQLTMREFDIIILALLLVVNQLILKLFIHLVARRKASSRDRAYLFTPTRQHGHCSL